MINSRCPELAAERKKRILWLLAGSGHPRCLYFHLVGKLWSVRMSLFSRREPKVMNKVSFGRRWIWIFLSLFSFTGWSHQTIYIYEYMNDGGQLKPEHCLVEIFPEILGHKAERTEKGPAKCVEICIPVVRVITKTLK